MLTKPAPGIAWRLRLAKKGGMTLFNGIPAEIAARATLLQRRRLALVAAGRAVRHKAAGRHNTADAWLRIAGDAVV